MAYAREKVERLGYHLHGVNIGGRQPGVICDPNRMVVAITLGSLPVLQMPGPAGGETGTPVLPPLVLESRGFPTDWRMPEDRDLGLRLALEAASVPMALTLLEKVKETRMPGIP